MIKLNLQEKSRHLLRVVRRSILRWSIQRPLLSTSILIFVVVSLLPIITAGTLMPLAFLFTYTGLLASQGIFFVTYNIFIQGLLLAALIVALFIIAFSIATSASVFHSYRVFRTSIMTKKKQ